ncbi:MAG: polymer-forming cytoskeletal protein [Patescibacteria group bacterium]|nr:polymer-forming cytoskeletal protein [Patescibacteria group bacterium]
MFEKDGAVSGPGTVVGANVKLNGILKDTNDITIHGHVDGEVISEKNIFVSETASVKGPVTAEEIIISGKVNGSITANKRLEISPSGKVYGSIATRDLIIKSGAQFVGKSAMLTEKEASAKTQDAIRESSEKRPLNKIKDKKSGKYELE